MYLIPQAPALLQPIPLVHGPSTTHTSFAQLNERVDVVYIARSKGQFTIGFQSDVFFSFPNYTVLPPCVAQAT